MSTSIILLDQNFNGNDVDIMVFEPCFFFPAAFLGEGGYFLWGGGGITYGPNIKLKLQSFKSVVTPPRIGTRSIMRRHVSIPGVVLGRRVRIALFSALVPPSGGSTSEAGSLG